MTDLRLTFLLWVPLFVAAVVVALARGFRDPLLFAVAMGVALWSLCEAAVLVVRKTREYAKSRHPKPDDDARR